MTLRVGKAAVQCCSMPMGKDKAPLTRTIRTAKQPQRPHPLRATRGQSDESKQTRKRMSDVLLEERLGLDHDWVERWEEGDGRLREESLAPSELPKFIEARIERTAKLGRTAKTVQNKLEAELAIKKETQHVNTAIDQLVAGGCCQPVVYYCLQELSPEAEDNRSKGEFMGATKKISAKEALAAKPSDDELDIPAVMVRSPLGTREDLKKVATAVAKASEMIHSYRRELRSLTEDAGITFKVPLPKGITVPRKALQLLQKLLTWVASLPDEYSAPFETNLFKSKGLLFLTAYVEFVADKNKVGRRTEAKMHRAMALLANIVMTKDDKTEEDKVKEQGKTEWSPSDLLVKLHQLEQDFPRQHKKLLRNLRELHEFHTSH